MQINKCIWCEHSIKMPSTLNAFLTRQRAPQRAQTRWRRASTRCDDILAHPIVEQKVLESLPPPSLLCDGEVVLDSMLFVRLHSGKIMYQSMVRLVGLGRILSHASRCQTAPWLTVLSHKISGCTDTTLCLMCSVSKGL